MIDYKVEEGKITSIDGYKVGGRDDVEPTKFSVINVGGNDTFKIAAGNYAEGDEIPYVIYKQISRNIRDAEKKALLYASTPILLSINTDPAYTVYKVGTAMFSIEPIINEFSISADTTDDSINIIMKYSAICIKAGTVAASDTFELRTRARVLLHNAKYIS